MKRQESKEDYLETILILQKRSGKVRSIDVVNELGYSKPSVSVAMKGLREQGLIHMDQEDGILLTEEGKKMAESVYERHTVLTKALLLLGVSEETAKEDACRMEHDISEETFARIREHVVSSGKGL